MWDLGESTAWIVVGLCGWALLLTSLAIVLYARARHDERPPCEPASSESVVGASSTRPGNDETDSTRADGSPPLDESGQANSELRLLQGLLPAVAALDLETILARGLRAAAEAGNASASVILLARGGEKPLIASLGMTSADSWQDGLGLPLESGEARAVELAYSYADDASAIDAFPLRSGLAVPIASEEERLGTLVVYWRRGRYRASEHELIRLEVVARATASALRIVLRLEEARPFELEGVTGLANARVMREALSRECARAGRYDRHLGFVLLRLDAPLTNEVLATAGRILSSAVRVTDLPCYLGEGSFGVILPEAAQIDAQQVHRRLGAVLGRELVGIQLGSPKAVAVEFRADEDAVSFFARARRELARAAQDEPRVSDEGSHKLRFTNA
jgi:GGDEF domain-containing protein